MRESFILLVVGATSAGAYILGARCLGLSRHGIVLALGRMLESVGMILVFAALNLVVALAALALARLVLRDFVSLYVANDVVLLLLSVLQGLGFQGWRAAAAR